MRSDAKQPLTRDDYTDLGGFAGVIGGAIGGAVYYFLMTEEFGAGFLAITVIVFATIGSFLGEGAEQLYAWTKGAQ